MRNRLILLAAWVAGVLTAPSPCARADLTPAGIFRLALVDLETVEPERRIYTRYAAMNGEAEADRELFAKAFTDVLNRLSFRTQFSRPSVINNILIRIDTRSVGWDRHERARQIANLSKIGIKFPDSNDPKFVDIWESAGLLDPFFLVTRYTHDRSHAVRGWINPEDAEKARIVAQTNYLVVSASRLLTVMLLEKAEGGLYSAILLLPDNERELLARFTNIATIDRERLKHGGAKIRSDYVALHSRGLEEIPSLFGFDQKYVHLTYDFKDDSKAINNPFETYAGKVKHDGREIIFSLPNGYWGSYLCDGGTGKNDGKQVNVVPPEIAMDLRPSKGVVYDRNVNNAIACIRCHGADGIIAYKDELRPLIVDLKENGKLVAKSKDPHFISETTADVEEYYEVNAGVNQPTGLEMRIALQQASYAARVKACNGLEPAVSSAAIVHFFDEYRYAPVTPERAAREIGMPLEEARELWLAASDPATAYLRVNEYNSLLANLRQGASIRRGQWERVLGEGLRSQIYADWEVANPEALKKALKAK